MITPLIALYTFLISISPFGEARVGIPFGIMGGLTPVQALIIGIASNVLIFPLFVIITTFLNRKLWNIRIYRKGSIKLAKRAKRIAGGNIKRYGFWGLMVFVMVPLPVTGAYMGSIAAMIFRIPRRQAFAAITLGVVVSCILVTTFTHLSILGLQLF